MKNGGSEFSFIRGFCAIRGSLDSGFKIFSTADVKPAVSYVRSGWLQLLILSFKIISSCIFLHPPALIIQSLFVKMRGPTPKNILSRKSA